MAKLPWFPMFPADFLSDENVLVMSNEEVGIYVKLLFHQWIEGTIPAEEGAMAKLCGCDGNRMATAWQQIGKCFVQLNGKPGRLVNPRLEQEREKQENKRKARQDAGLRGAEARWKPDGIAIVLPLAKNGESESEVEPEPEIESKDLTTLPPTGAPPITRHEPKPPGENAAPGQMLSWHIHEGRLTLYEDGFYDPWNRKALGICKNIFEKKAKSNFNEALTRLRVLFLKCTAAPPGSDYWVFTPENFSSKWSQLVGDPKLRIEKQSREGAARQAYEERIRILTEGGKDVST